MIVYKEIIIDLSFCVSPVHFVLNNFNLEHAETMMGSWTIGQYYFHLLKLLVSNIL